MLSISIPVYNRILLRFVRTVATILWLLLPNEQNKIETIMKIATLVARIALGLIYTVFSAAFFFNLLPNELPEGSAGQFVMGLAASGYIMYVVKVIELVCGIALLFGRFVPLASVVIFPITLNIFLFHAFLAPDGLIMGIVMLAGNLLLFYRHRDSYGSMLAWK